MTFSLEHHWVWDFWLADDGERFHMYYLHAPKSLGDQQLRHRNAQIGHATSLDLATWTDHGVVIRAGGPGEFDETATWTGSVVHGPDGVWRMFYTGARFLSETSNANVETVGVATSADLHTWVKSPGPIAKADPRWYETLGTSDWPEEAWRDPWVFADPNGDGWHMLVTARANRGDVDERGVVGHATSSDLERWEVQPPMSEPGAGFAHLEVPQIATVDDRLLLLFSCDSGALSSVRRKKGDTGGIWALAPDSLLGPYAVGRAELIAPESLYSGRVIRDRHGEWVLLAFENTSEGGDFVGTLGDPLRFAWRNGGPSIQLAAKAGTS
ncbi:glycoside hydrolase family 68 protein [Lacisediminihabitans profunda]|uniref:beta-fructofuranosidase n=1 Tax=Lacisediminihabitans profunda TaxID=2594790 RepID=A0A5C8UMB2_9MICO|nr:glycoside hydrolase family 68 protein [Lacisediminihabitans profunda]TXN29330.1 glycosyl hydrolase family 32 [Lacisediminihabitans profunda]